MSTEKKTQSFSTGTQEAKIASQSNFDLMQYLTEDIPSRICMEQLAGSSSNRLSKVTMEQYLHMDKQAQARPIP